MRILALITDGFGGSGGIARYNCDLVAALAASPNVHTVIVQPRFGSASAAELPPRIVQSRAEAGRLAYSARTFDIAFRKGPFDLVLCGHLFAAPLAAAVARVLGRPLWLQLHGIEAWEQPGRLVRAAAERATLVTAVSRFTRRRFLAWANVDPARVAVLPNTFEPKFAPGPKPAHLLARYGLAGRRILLTVSRLASGERYKGHDRVIAALPAVRASHPEAIYVIAGDGDDRGRLEQLASDGGVAEHVRFIGRVDAAELADVYRLADVFVMPSTGEGFGIVFLEAAAAGLPVIAGNRDGSVDALADGKIGTLVDPDDGTSLSDAISNAFNRPAIGQNEHVRFGTNNFRGHVGDLVHAAFR